MNGSSLNKKEISYEIEPEASFDMLMICPLPIIKLKLTESYIGLCVLRFGSGSAIMFWWNILIIIKNAQVRTLCIYALCCLPCSRLHYYYYFKCEMFKMASAFEIWKLSLNAWSNEHIFSSLSQNSFSTFSIGQTLNACTMYDCEKSTMWMTSNRQLKMIK